MRSLVILGSTGSIGENALRVAAALPGRLRVTGLATRTHAARVLEQAAIVEPEVTRQRDRRRQRLGIYP